MPTKKAKAEEKAAAVKAEEAAAKAEEKAADFDETVEIELACHYTDDDGSHEPGDTVTVTREYLDRYPHIDRGGDVHQKALTVQIAREAALKASQLDAAKSQAKREQLLAELRPQGV